MLQGDLASISGNLVRHDLCLRHNESCCMGGDTIDTWQVDWLKGTWSGKNTKKQECFIFPSHITYDNEFIHLDMSTRSSFF